MKPKQKYLLLIIIGTILIAALTVGGLLLHSYFTLRAGARALVNVLQTKDIEQINTLLFLGSSIALPDDLPPEVVAEFQSTEDESDSNKLDIFEPLVQRANAKVEKIAWVPFSKSATVTYSISAQDLRTYFEYAQQGEATKDAMLKALQHFINEAPQLSSDVTLAFMRVNGDWSVNYQNADLLDALTGGLLKAYQGAYVQALLEIYEQGAEQ